MKIAFDAQLLFEEQKTGIGWTTEYLLKNLKTDDNNEYILNYFPLIRIKEKNRIVNEYKKIGYQIKKCRWFHYGVYHIIWNRIPVPYSLFFGKKARIIQFFNYEIPPGVNGKAVTFIYDMVYKAFPETMSKETLKTLEDNLNKVCKLADHIITISNFSKLEIMKYMNLPENKISVMPCGVDHSIYHPNYSEYEVYEVKRTYGINGDYILYLGTLEPRKNIERLVESYALLKKETENIPKLVIAGKKGWSYDKIFNLVEKYSLSEDIIFTDYVAIQDVPLLYKGAISFVFPSLYEGFGLPPIEAMACGTPVITSSEASLPEVVGDAAILVDPYDIHQLKDAMKNIVSNPDLRIKLAEKGMERSRLFSWEYSSKTLKEIYNSL